MLYPKELKPNSTESFLIKNEIVSCPFNAAFDIGLSSENFLMVEWKIG
jgi:hypothetical protein